MRGFMRFLDEKRKKYLPDDWIIFQGKEMQRWASIDLTKRIYKEYAAQKEELYFLIKVEAYDVTIRMYSVNQFDLIKEIPSEDWMVVTETELWERLTELV